LEWAQSFQHEWKITVPKNGTDYNVTVDHCLVGEAANQEARCGFHYSAYLILAVCVLTSVASILVACKHNKSTIVLVGDALENFLEQKRITNPSIPSHEYSDLAILQVRKWLANTRTALVSSC
jgi:hypothetical protein